MTKLFFQKWHIKITLIINNEFSLTRVALKDILFRFISPRIPKEIYSLNNISIIKEIDKERIYKKKQTFVILKEIILYKRIANQLTNPILNHEIKLFRQQIETEICSNLPTAFWHRHRHIVQLRYEFYFSAIKKLLGTYITTSATTCSLIALVSLRLVGKP